MKLSIPFIPDEKYTNFLKNEIQNIESVYFSLHQGPVLDARMRFKKVELSELTKGLKKLGDVKKYVLLNSRFINPGLYRDTKFLNQSIDKLEILAENVNLTGIVFSDAYFLNALAGTEREVISRLEAVPGINCMLDTAQKAFVFMELIEKAGFKYPGKLILDRALNRDLNSLSDMAQKVKTRYKSLTIELLANEGCIYHCPFKLAHDSQISYLNLTPSPTADFMTNQSVGCHTYFHDSPWHFFKSPFIRPEDVDEYKGIADSIKLCGRTLGINFLTQCITAYIKKSFEGNLLELMDATHWLSDLYYIENKMLDPVFFKQVTPCTKECKKCSMCSDLFSKTAKRQSIGLKNYKDYL